MFFLTCHPQLSSVAPLVRLRTRNNFAVANRKKHGRTAFRLAHTKVDPIETAVRDWRRRSANRRVLSKSRGDLTVDYRIRDGADVEIINWLDNPVVPIWTVDGQDVERAATGNKELLRVTLLDHNRSTRRRTGQREKTDRAKKDEFPSMHQSRVKESNRTVELTGPTALPSSLAG